jgi:hypothetical protein
MVDIRQAARGWLAQVPDRPAIIKSTEPKFEQLTGTSHATMKKNWDGGGIMTACNGFTGKYGVALRGLAGPACKAPTAYLGRFDLATYLPTIGMGHAWVKSSPTNWPYYGDICRHKAFHVGVSLDFIGEQWEHADAGQGGKGVGYDILKRTLSKDNYDWTKLEGWIDIEVYYGTAPQTGKVPDWLQGWWNIEWEGDSSYYYYYGTDRRVFWTKNKPFDMISRPTGYEGVGNFTIDDLYIAIWWASGTVEVYQRSDDDPAFMQGTWNNTEEIKGTKL